MPACRGPHGRSSSPAAAGFIGSHLVERLLAARRCAFTASTSSTTTIRSAPQDPQHRSRASATRAFVSTSSIWPTPKRSRAYAQRIPQPGRGGPSRRGRRRAPLGHRSGALRARQRRGHAERARRVVARRECRSSSRARAPSTATTAAPPFSEDEPCAEPAEPLRRHQAQRCELLCRVAHHIHGSSHHDAALFHRLRAAAASRPRHPQVQHRHLAPGKRSPSSATARWPATSRTSATSCAASCTPWRENEGFRTVNLGNSSPCTVNSPRRKARPGARRRAAVRQRRAAARRDGRDLRRHRARPTSSGAGAPRVALDDGLRDFAGWISDGERRPGRNP